jgi:predicted SprT family Zn-dependent metalloprotease
MITDIEKQIHVEKLFHSIWQQYMDAIDSKLIINSLGVLQKGIKKPELVCICKGVNYAGRYFPSGNIMQINTAYYDGINDIDLQQTIAHELAHHLQWMLFPQFKQWHGPEFRHIMQGIGYSGDTYHNMSPAVAVQRAKAAKTELFEF